MAEKGGGHLLGGLKLIDESQQAVPPRSCRHIYNWRLNFAYHRDA
jgi:hypothetical protein